jgi:aspartyl/asparaginyl beta-hydroxylase (cupin superfamily)
MEAFVARENIKRFKAQLRSTDDEAQKVTLRKLLEEEEQHLQQIIDARHAAG